MTEKLTPEEIKKALECCEGESPDCTNCPANKYEAGKCFDKVKVQAVAVMNSQQAEIENCYKFIEQLKEARNLWEDKSKEQQAEIERLREIRDLCNTTILEKNEQIGKLKISDASKEECTIRQHGEIKELKAEIERLSDRNKKCIYLSDEETTEYCVDAICPKFKTEAQIKSEAIKEFAERITDKASIYRVNGFDYAWQITQEDIDNLVKEMVGEDK